MKVNIELPFFPGFYESDLENSDTPYWAIKEELEYYQNECDTPCKELTENDLDFDYKGYEEAVRDGWVDGFRERMPEMVLSLENVEMTSPKYYNFSTDKLWADVELKDGWPEFAPWEGRCFFQPCYHATEPRCAVRDAVAAGEIDAERHGRYVELLDEMKMRWRDRYD